MTDTQLLFVVLAFECELIDLPQLTAACRASTVEESEPMADLLVARGWLMTHDREFIEGLVERKLAKHQHDPRATLNALINVEVRDIVKEFENTDIQPCPAAGPVFLETVVEPLAEEREQRKPQTQEPQTESQPTQSRYTLISEVGKGGLGRVWLAKDNIMAREVVLKEIKPGRSAASREAMRRLIKEAQITGQLQHPNIVPVYDVNHGCEPFYTMKLVKGETLSDAIKRHHEQHLSGKEAWLSLLRLLNIFVNVCEALAYAHSRGIIHRDLKPLNVVLGDYGEAIVIDWGLAKQVDSVEDAAEPVALTDAAQSSATIAGQIQGTPKYMAPEQAEGRIDLIDARTDIYALGVILFEILTGRRPFEGTLQEILTGIKKGEAPRARQIVAEAITPVELRPNSAPFVPTALDAVCAKAMAKQREDRHAKAAELAQDIRNWLAEVSEEATRMRRLLYVAHMNLAQIAWEDNQIPKVLGLLEAHRPQEDQEDLRGFEWFYWDRLCHNDVLTLKGHKYDVKSVMFSPDGKWLASASEDKTIKVWDAATGQELRTIEHGARVKSLAFSPDGGRLASTSGNTVKVWDAATGQGLLTLKGHTLEVSSVAFSPDGQRLTSASDDFTVKVWDAATGMESLTLAGHTHWVSSVAFSPDGKHIASTSYGTVKVWDAITGEEQLTLKGHSVFVSSVAFSPDGKRLASACNDQTIKLWDMATGRELLTLIGHTAGVNSVAFSPDGMRLASASGDYREPGVVKVWNATTGEILSTLKGHIGGVSSVTFSPDGRWLASASDDKTVKLWDAATGQESRTLWTSHDEGSFESVTFSSDGQRLAFASNEWTDAADYGKVVVWDVALNQVSLVLRELINGVNGVAFSPDGKRLASGSSDQTIKVWDAITGQESFTLKGHTGGVSSVTFSPDGQWLASASGDQTVRVWDADTGQEALTLKGHTDYVLSVAYSPAGQRLASASQDQMIKLWDAVNGKELLTLKGHTGHVSNVAFSPDEKWLASASQDQTIKLWDAATGQESLTLKGHTAEVSSVTFSPDGKRLVSASQDRTIKLWDVATGQELLTLKGHSGRVDSVAFSPDGKRLASTSGGLVQSVKVWDAVTVQKSLVLKGRAEGADSLSISANGRLTLPSGDETVKLWGTTSQGD